MVVDFHAHAFPDELAPRAVGGINAGIPEHAHAVLDGTVGDLIASMDRAGIRRSVLWSIATRPTQVDAIIRWSLSVAAERIVPFGSVHPDCADPLWPLYAAVEEAGLILAFHAGSDVAYPPPDDRAAPRRILRVHGAFPHVRIVAAHMGGWRMWDEVAETLAGTDVYLETSYTFDTAGPEQLRRLLERHPPERILFGTDSPWRDQAGTLELVRAAFPDPAVRRLVLEDNAERLLSGE